VYIVAGLGNPGIRYADTRHNIGFVVLDMLAERLGIKIKKVKHKAILGEGIFAGEKVVLAKPQTYMNLSGESILALKNWYKVEDSGLIIIYDDIDLDVGVLRIRDSGSAGTPQWYEKYYLPVKQPELSQSPAGHRRTPSKLGS